MGRYIDFSDVANRYKDAATYGDAETLEVAYIVAAEAEVDGRLARLYPIPFPSSPAPDIVRDLCIDMVYIKLTQGKVKTVEIQAAVTQRFKDINSRALLISLNGTLIDPAPITATDSLPGTMYGYDDPANWDVSSYWEQASQDERDYASSVSS